MNAFARACAQIGRARMQQFSRLAFAAATGSVTLVSLLPAEVLPHLSDLSDKLEHALAYAVLGALAALSWRRPRERLIAGAALVALGGMLEILQNWIPGRSGEWLDLAADAAGVLAAFAVAAARRSWSAPA